MYDAQTRAVAADLMQLRMAQQGYVAQGQGTDFWMQRAAEHLSRVDRGMASMAADAKAEGTRTAVQAARAAFDNFRKFDQRARQYVGRWPGADGVGRHLQRKRRRSQWQGER